MKVIAGTNDLARQVLSGVDNSVNAPLKREEGSDTGSVMAESKRERYSTASRGEREKMGRKEEGGPNNGNKLGPTRIESGFEFGLDSKTGERLNSNLAWDPHKIQVGISILT